MPNRKRAFGAAHRRARQGIAYVEFERIEDCQTAVMKSGQVALDSMPRSRSNTQCPVPSHLLGG